MAQKSRLTPFASAKHSWHHDHEAVTMESHMQIPAGEFKAKCLKLMDQVARSGVPIVITKRGKPVAKLVPPDETEARAPLFGYLAGCGSIRGDIVDVPEVEWSVLSRDDDLLYEVPAGTRTTKVAERRPRRKRR
jgi:prevent-host-death family protein